MLNEKEVAGKLNALAAEFRTLMEHKEYAKAKNRYDTALNIAVALELPEHTKRNCLETGRFRAFDGKWIVLT